MHLRGPRCVEEAKAIPHLHPVHEYRKPPRVRNRAAEIAVFLQFRPLIGDQRLRRTPFVTDDGGVVRACRAT